MSWSPAKAPDRFDGAIDPKARRLAAGFGKTVGVEEDASAGRDLPDQLGAVDPDVQTERTAAIGDPRLVACV